MSESDWDQWMGLAQAGDGAAYRRLLGEIQPWLLRYYARRLPPSFVDDAVQDALVSIHAKRHTYDPARPFGPWLSAVARHKWIDRLRAIGRNKSEPLNEDIAVPDHETAVASAFVLNRLLAGLKPAQAEVIRLVKLQGLSIEEASSATGQSASLVKVNIHRGLSRLSRDLQEGSDAR